MSKGDYLFTIESVSEGHPDKICDLISDAVLDTYLTADPYSRVACETLCTTNRIVLAGEVRGPESITTDHLEDVARHCVKQVGYEQDGFHWQKAEVQIFLHQQSAATSLTWPASFFPTGAVMEVIPTPFRAD